MDFPDPGYPLNRLFSLVLLSNSSIATTSLSWPQARGSSAISAKGV